MMKKIRAFMVIAVFYPFVGGAEMQAQQLAHALLKKNVAVTVVTGRWSNRLKSVDMHNGIKIVRNLTNFNFFTRGPVNTSLEFFNTGVSASNAIARVIKTLAKKIFIRSSIYIYQFSLFFLLIRYRKQYDIIHAHQILYPACIATTCGKLLNKPVIAKIGSSGFNSDINQIRQFPEGKLQLQYIFRNIHKIIYTSKIMKDEFIDAGLKEDKLVFLPNGVHITDYRRSYQKCNHLVYLGRFKKTKDLDTLIQDYSMLLKNFDQKLKLTLIGDGPERDHIQNLIKKLGIGSQIELTGFLEKPAELLKKSDLFVFPSLIEGLPNSLIEAMSYKLPCIVTNIPGNVQLIGEGDTKYKVPQKSFTVTKYGALVNKHDVQGFYHAAVFLMKNLPAREKLGQASYKKVKNAYNIENIVKKYKKLYGQLIGNGPKA